MNSNYLGETYTEKVNVTVQKFHDVSWINSLANCFKQNFSSIGLSTYSTKSSKSVCMLIWYVIHSKGSMDTELWDNWLCRAEYPHLQVCAAVHSEQCAAQPRAQMRLTVQKGSSWPFISLSSIQQLFWLQTSTGWLLMLFFFWFCNSDEMLVTCCV